MARTGKRVLLMYAQWVERLKPPTVGHEEWLDAKEAGLALRVLPSGRKTWYVLYRRKGDPTRKRRHLGIFPAVTLKDARDAAAKVKLDAAMGLEFDEAEGGKGGPTFKAVALEFVDKYAKPRKRSWGEDDRRIRNVLLPAWEHHRAREIRRKDVIALLDRIAAKHPIEANRTLALVRKIFKWAKARGHVSSNPCLEIEAPGVERSRDRVLADDELRSAWDAFGQLGDDARDAFRLLAITLQRSGEVKAMAWADVDLETAWWEIPGHKTKNAKNHRVPLTAPALAILKKRQVAAGDNRYVFEGRDGKKVGHIVNLHRSLVRARELSGVAFWLHDLRRTGATGMAEEGVPDADISRVLNHSAVGDGARVTQVYNRYKYDREKRAALEAWSARLKRILTPKKEVSPQPLDLMPEVMLR